MGTILKSSNDSMLQVSKVLIILFAAQVLALIQPGKLHVLLGFLFIAFLGVHALQHKKWFTSLRKGRYTKKRIVRTVIIAATLLLLVVLLVSGFFVPGTTKQFLFQGLGSCAGILHVVFTVGACVALAFHVKHSRSPFKKKAKTSR